LVRHLSHAIAAVDGDCDLAAVSVDELTACAEAWCGGPAQIIVDDLHEIAGTEAKTALERFLLLRPRRVRALAERRVDERCDDGRCGLGREGPSRGDALRGRRVGASPVGRDVEVVERSDVADEPLRLDGLP